MIVQNVTFKQLKYEINLFINMSLFLIISPRPSPFAKTLTINNVISWKMVSVSVPKTGFGPIFETAMRVHRSCLPLLGQTEC